MTIRDRIINAMAAVGAVGMTYDEVETVLGLMHNAGSPRFGDLVRSGILVANGMRRKTRTGRSAAVYVLNPDRDKSPGRTVTVLKETSAPSAKAFWRDIRKRVEKYVSQQVRKVDALATQRIFAELEADLRSCTDRAINQLRQIQLPPPPPPSRHAILDACRTLGLDPPPIGSVPAEDWKRKAKQHMRSMVREYHPDVAAKSNDSTRAMFDAVIAAYGVLENYQTTFKKGQHDA